MPAIHSAAKMSYRNASDENVAPEGVGFCLFFAIFAALKWQRHMVRLTIDNVLSSGVTNLGASLGCCNLTERPHFFVNLGFEL